MAVSPRKLDSSILNPIRNAVLMTRVGDLGLSHRHGARTERRVALAFDDGPVADGTEDALDALAEYQAPATVFCVGVNVRQHPENVRRATAAGHVIGAHSMNHSRLTRIAPVDSAQIDECVNAIREIIGKAPARFRVPWGWITPWEVVRLRRRGVTPIRWDTETSGSLEPCHTGEQNSAWTLHRMRPGSILVFHDGIPHGNFHSGPLTAAVLCKIAPELSNIQVIRRRSRRAAVAMYLSPALKRLESDRDNAR
jgi:peptidoglycan-N-acetylglucosamine deacetylase